MNRSLTAVVECPHLPTPLNNRKLLKDESLFREFLRKVWRDSLTLSNVLLYTDILNYKHASHPLDARQEAIIVTLMRRFPFRDGKTCEQVMQQEWTLYQKEIKKTHLKLKKTFIVTGCILFQKGLISDVVTKILQDVFQDTLLNLI